MTSDQKCGKARCHPDSPNCEVLELWVAMVHEVDNRLQGPECPHKVTRYNSVGEKDLFTDETTSEVLS